MLNKQAINNGKRNRLFIKMMLYILLASVLMAFLSSLMFFFFGGRRYSKQMLEEMLPRAASISNIMSEYYDGVISEQSVNRYIYNNRNNRDATVLVFDAQASLFNASRIHFPGDIRRTDEDRLSYFKEIALKVLSSGETVQLTRLDLVLIAMPVNNSVNRTVGAVLLIKMSDDLHRAMHSIMFALIMCFCIVILFMIVFAYFGSKRITDPILKMEAIAEAMQKGDFSQKADDSIENEIGQLGGALNALSSELSKTIKDLDQAKNMRNQILNSLSEGVAAFEKNNLIFCNPAVLSLFNLTEQQIETRTFVEIVPDFNKHYYQALQNQGSEYVEIRYRERILGCSFMKLEPSEKDSTGMVLLIRDITEAVRLEQTRRDYVANVSHELRTPITSIRSLAETLNDGLVNEKEEQNRYYGNILRESIRMSHLIEELLELSRIQCGSVAFKKETFCLNELLNGLIDRMRIIAEYSGILLNYTCEDPITVCSNRSRIEQVCVAIIDNAIKYCNDSGEINVSVTTDDNKAFVSISNDGFIDDKDLPHLFERFYKADKSHRGNGTGLGLAITKEVLERLGENIHVSSEDNKVSFVFTIGLFDANTK